ncbi:septal ring lytic transglycosylase RlpA family protein [Rhizobium sp. SGZ-381]|uniref:septal ring lytic transglycosylase RlpA family protein n=1 Tax=Rhizobium sp. SGZ-381 TaxID=3342800 RepID=UPI00366F17CC
MTSESGKLHLGARWLGITLVCVGMASCAATPSTTVAKKNKPKSKEYFSESEYGVKASPRVVAEGQPVPKGGGRFLVGNPYEVKGKVYVPKEDPNYNRSGLASWYGSAFHGRVTANGEVYDTESISAAHPTFPLPSYARVTNTDTGSSVIVRVNDRGPFHPGRLIDVSSKAADLLDFKRTGTAHVNVQYVGRARMDGRDMPFLMASYIRKGDRMPGIHPDGQVASGVMVASNQSLGDQLQSYGNGGPTAYAGSTPTSGSTTKRQGSAFAAVARTYEAAPLTASGLPHSAPAPYSRPGTAHGSEGRTAEAKPAAKASQSYAVASLPAAVAKPVEARPVVQKQPAVSAKPVAVQPVAQARPVMPPVEAPVRKPARQASAPSTQTAYAAPVHSAAQPQVIFGNVILRDDGRIEPAVPQKAARP